MCIGGYFLTFSFKKIDQHTHDMTHIEGGHVDDRVGAVPGPDSVNRRVSGPGTEPGSVPGLARLKLAIYKRGFCYNCDYKLVFVLYVYMVVFG